MAAIHAVYVCPLQPHVLLLKCGLKAAAELAAVVVVLVRTEVKVVHTVGSHVQPVLPIKFYVHVHAYALV